MRFAYLVLALAAVLHWTPAAAEAPEVNAPVVVAALASSPSSVVARIDLSTQRMRVYVNDALTYTFAVSTGRGRYATPTGRWRAQWLSPKHRSRKYNNAPMPWSVFFHRGYAVHGTTEVSALGRPASHGCVRLSPDNAKVFYALVKQAGLANTFISIAR